MHRGKRLVAIVTALAVAAAIVASCATGGGLSIAQRAYNTCTDNHNDQRAGLDQYWAFVAGVGSSDDTCYWRWGAQTVAAAVELAMGDCREEYEDCYLYSSSGGNSDWVQQISDNGGTDGSGDGGGGMSFSDFVEWGTFALSLGTIGVQTYDSIENGGGGDGGYSAPSAGYSGGGGGGSDCSPHWTLYQQCLANKNSLSSAHDVPLGENGCVMGTISCGEGGQAGYQENCETQYLASYNACVSMQ
jgi:hypothetical protein